MTEARKTFKKLGVALGIIAFGSLLAILVSFAAWDPPTAVPPGANAEAPLNVSSLGQAKAGGLVINTGGATDGLIVASGNVGIGNLSPSEVFDVNGESTFNNNLVHGVATPIDGLDAVNKDYVDAAVGQAGDTITLWNTVQVAMTQNQPQILAGAPACPATHPNLVYSGFGPHWIGVYQLGDSATPYLSQNWTFDEWGFPTGFTLELEGGNTAGFGLAAFASDSVCSMAAATIIPTQTSGNGLAGNSMAPRSAGACVQDHDGLGQPLGTRSCNVCSICTNLTP